MPTDPIPPKPRPGLGVGFFSPWHGARFLLRHPQMIPLTIIPIVINVILFSVFFLLGLKYFGDWLNRLLPQSEAWYWTFLSFFLAIVLALVLLLIIVLTFTAVANILASPFNDALSSKTEALITGRPEAPFSFRAALREAGRTIVEELKKIVFFLAVLVGLLLLHLLPLLGSFLYTIAFTLFTILWLGLNFLDYALARHNYRLGGKLKFVRLNLRPVLGYGLGVFAGLLIPVFNLVFIPLAVVGGTILYLDLKRD